VLTLPRDLCRSPTGLLQGRNLSLWRFYNTKRKRKYSSGYPQQEALPSVLLDSRCEARLLTFCTVKANRESEPLVRSCSRGTQRTIVSKKRRAEKSSKSWLTSWMSISNRTVQKRIVNQYNRVQRGVQVPLYNRIFLEEKGSNPA
jgi:hypothetical protein